VSFAAFESYYDGAAETWEYLALTRARVVWASSAAFAARAAAAIEAKLRRPREAAATAGDVLEMRALMARERPAEGFWDFKLIDGGLVDIEFAGQFLQLIHANAGGPLRPAAADALAALNAAGLAPAELTQDLLAAWRLQQDLAQLLRVALGETCEPEREPKALQAMMAKMAGARDLRALRAELTRRRKSAHSAYRAILTQGGGDGTARRDR
jgi:glutamate-ammonia-ligase adenylyltransferase